MKALRFILPLILLALPARVLAQEAVQVKLEKTHVKPGEPTTVTIEINIQTRPPMREPPPDYVPGSGRQTSLVRAAFTVNGPPGTKFAKVSISGAGNEFGDESGRTFYLEPTLDHWTRAKSTVVLQVTAPETSGEALISVSGQHGSAPGGMTPWNYRGSAKLMVEGAPGSGVGGPTHEIPFTATPGTVNPTKEMISRLTPIGIILAAAGVVTYLGRKGRLRGSPATVTGHAPPQSAKHSGARRDPDDDKQQGAGVYLHIQPTDEVVVPADRKDAGQSFKFSGNGKQWVYAAVVIEPAKGFEVDTPLKFNAATPPNAVHGPWEIDTMGGWFTGAGEPLYLKAPVLWQWENQQAAAVQVPTFPYNLINQSSRAFVPKKAVVPAKTISILGANPELEITPDKKEVSATGWNTFGITSKLWLFHEPTEAGQEKIKVHEVCGALNEGPLAMRHRPAAGKEPEGWAPPLLVQQQGYVDEAEIWVKWEWIGGEQWNNAVGPQRSKVYDTSRTSHIDLLGCSIRAEAVTATFCPVKGTKLFGKAWLVDGDGNAVTPKSRDASPGEGLTLEGSRIADKVEILCEVRDVSSGKPGHSTECKDCKTPPRSVLDVEGAPPTDLASGQKEWERILAAKKPDTTIQLQAAPSGRLFAPMPPRGKQRWWLSNSDSGAKVIEKEENDPEQIFLMEYSVAPGLDPIHDAPVIFTVIIKDGYGGTAKASNFCRVALGSIVLETGGKDFSIYEYRPHLFEAVYQPAEGFIAEIHDDLSTTLTWEFALMGEKNQPKQLAGRITTKGTMLIGKFPLVLGHLRTDRLMYFHRDNGKLLYIKPEKEGSDAPPEPHKWRKVGPQDDSEFKFREHARQLAEMFHALPTIEEDALQWLPPREDGSKWKDRTLAMSVRIEMRDKDGSLLATSDRLVGNYQAPEPAEPPPSEVPSSEAPPAPPVARSSTLPANYRTPPEMVWGDHRFKFVLKMLRLVDHLGLPYVGRFYELHLAETEKELENRGGKRLPRPGSKVIDTGKLGIIEELLEPEAEFAWLTLGDSLKDDVVTFRLKLGHLLPDDFEGMTGVKARLNNLGFFAGLKANDDEDALFKRAIRRLERAYLLGDPTPQQKKDDPSTVTQRTSDLLRDLDQKFVSHYDDPFARDPKSAQPPPMSSADKPAGEKSPPILDPLCVRPPDRIAVDREALVALHLPTTLRVPMDTNRRPQDWYPKLQPRGTARLEYPDPIPGNEVAYLMNGSETFADMLRAMRGTYGSPAGNNYFIYMANWMIELGLALVNGDTSSMLTSVLRRAALEQNVQVRALMWKQKPAEEATTIQYAQEVNEYGDSAVSTGTRCRSAALIDGRTLNYGSHHQKILTVNGKDGLEAFCGGLDFAGDRMKGLHDVHCRVRGPAAMALLHIFHQRWADHPDSSRVDQEKGTLRSLSLSAPPSPQGRNVIQVGRTYPDGHLHAGIDVDDTAGGDFPPSRGYSFADRGEDTARQMILHAVSKAQRFIYIEEQYFTPCEEFLRALQAVAGRLKHITILTTHELETDLHKFWGKVEGTNQCGARRLSFLQRLRDATPHPERIQIAVLKRSLERKVVHAKLYIVDDEYAIIGSAHVNNRSLTHDSEAICGISEGAPFVACGYDFAHRLRIKLWAEHLNMNTPEGHAELADGAAASVHWKEIPDGAHVQMWDETVPFDTSGTDAVWNTGVDPVGL